MVHWQADEKKAGDRKENYTLSGDNDIFLALM